MGEAAEPSERAERSRRSPLREFHCISAVNKINDLGGVFPQNTPPFPPPFPLTISANDFNVLTALFPQFRQFPQHFREHHFRQCALVVDGQVVPKTAPARAAFSRCLFENTVTTFNLVR